jgi:hypothetical protein
LELLFNRILMQEDYYSALASVVMGSARKNPQLRTMIYELARSKLRERLQRQAKAVSHSERARQLLALENAIEQIEADLAEGAPSDAYSRVDAFAPAGYPSVEILPPARDQTRLSEAPLELTSPRSARPSPSLVPSVLTLLAAAMLGAAAYIGIQHGFLRSVQSRGEGDQNIADYTTNSSNRPVVPMPTAFGVYALTNGQLTELQPLPIRVPVPGVAISGRISSPSTTKLPVGRAQFIVFKRELVRNLPEKIEVRVVAQVMSAKTGSATTISEPTWAVRGISYEMKVAPIHGNLAMIFIHPADPDFSFPAGRYALALNTMGYDFSVDGPITDSSQCVELNDETAALEYTECRKR